MASASFQHVEPKWNLGMLAQPVRYFSLINNQSSPTETRRYIAVGGPRDTWRRTVKEEGARLGGMTGTTRVLA